MKELSIEEKAKRYDGLIERLKDLQFAYRFSPLSDTIEEKFPELKESEDEMIRKKIIATIHLYYGEPLEDEAKEMIAWLEKQGEQKTADKKGMNLVEEEMTPFQKKVFCIIDTAIEEEQGLKQVCDELLALAKHEIEQKPAWSEEDEELCEYLVKSIEESDPLPTSIYSDCKKWLKSLKDRVQPKQEWSDDDEKRMNHIIQFLEDKDRWKDSERAFPIEEDIRWLKDLKPQNRWKPSEEQITWLYRATDEVRKDSRMKQVLNGLLCDLKKLREE